MRAQAVHALGLLGMEQHADLVLAALDDQSDFVGMTAMRALARPAQAAHAPGLVARLDRFQAWDGGFLASVLAAIGPAVSPPLCGVLADDRRGYRVRWVAAEALRRLHHLPAGTIAASVAETSSNRDLVAACLRLLEAMGHSGHLPVIRALAASSDEVIRQQAVRALGTLEEPARMPSLVEHLADPSAWVGMEAGRALARFEGGRLLSPVAAGSGNTATIAAQALMEARA
jgi:HEAT repeat protein